MSIVKPSQWVVGIAFPSTLDEFAQQNRRLERHDWVAQYAGDAGRYERNFLSTLNPVIADYRAAGVDVRCAFGLLDLRNVLSLPECRVFTLFAHWARPLDQVRPRVDLFDGMTDIDEIVRAVPDDFDGFMDLCVCSPTGLATRLRARKPNISGIKFLDKRELRILLWLRLYRAVFQLLLEGEYSALRRLMG